VNKEILQSQNIGCLQFLLAGHGKNHHRPIDISPCRRKSRNQIKKAGDRSPADSATETAKVSVYRTGQQLMIT
jgi:hypothetical protein